MACRTGRRTPPTKTYLRMDCCTERSLLAGRVAAWASGLAAVRDGGSFFASDLINSGVPNPVDT